MVKQWIREQDSAMAASGMKQCRGPCHKAQPRESFDADKTKPDGLKPWCKECRKARRDAKAKTTIDQMIEQMDENLLIALRDAKPGGTNLPHQVQALECIVSLLGGVQGFAMFWVGNMLAAPPGSQTRERMLGKVQSAIQMCSDDGKVSKPRELMTDEELKASIDERVKRLGLQVVEATDVRESA